MALSTARINHTQTEFSNVDSMFPNAINPDPFLGCIGANYSAEFDFTLSGSHADGTALSLAGAEIFIDLARFIPTGQYWYPSGTTPRAGWIVRLPTPYAAGTYNFVPVNFGQTEDTLANTVIELTTTTSTTYTIVIKSDRFLMDFDEYHRQHAVDHNDVLLRSSIRAPRREDNSYYASAYRNKRSLGLYTVLTHNGKKVYNEVHAPVSLRFWNVDTNDDLADFVMTVELERASAVVEDFSSFVDTRVNLYFTKPAGYKLVNVVAFLWEESEDNENSWMSDLNFSAFKLTNDLAGASKKDGRIYAPTKALTYNAGPGRYEAYFRVPASTVVPGKRYRVAAYSTVQTDPGAVYQYVQSFLSRTRYTTDAPPSYFALGITPLVWDYDKNLNTNLVEKATAADRYGIKLELDKVAYDAAFGAGSFEDDLATIRLRIYEYATPDTYLANFSLNRVDGIFPDNHKAIKVDEDPTSFAAYTVIRAQQLNSQGFLDLAGKDIVVEFAFRFDYGGSPSYSYNYLYKTRIKFRDYENALTLPTRKIEGIYYFDADTGLPITSLCDVSRVLVEVRLESGHGSTGSNIHFRGLLDTTPYGSTFWNDGALVEFDGYAGNHPTLEGSPIESAEEFFDTDGVARMIVDVSTQPLGLERRIIAIKGGPI